MGESLDLHSGFNRSGGIAGTHLENALRDGIRAGRRRTGSQLTGSRTLAADLGLERGTVAPCPVGAVNICDDEPAPGTQWVPAFCAATGTPAPVRSEGERH